MRIAKIAKTYFRGLVCLIFLGASLTVIASAYAEGSTPDTPDTIDSAEPQVILRARHPGTTPDFMAFSPTPILPSTPTDASVPLPAPADMQLESQGKNFVAQKSAGIQAVPGFPVESWRARKGETVRDVLQRWSVRGGTNLMWASADSPVLQKGFTYVGKFQDAVNALIRAEGGDRIHSQYRSEGLNPVMMAPASTVTTSAPAIDPISPIVSDKNSLPAAQAQPVPLGSFSEIFQPEQKKDVRPETRWFALSGAPLAEVLQIWSDDAGIQLIWQSERNFAVKESISQIGHFEDAIFKALSQYNADDIRPVGEIYRDPQSGQQVLVVRTEVN